MPFITWTERFNTFARQNKIDVHMTLIAFNSCNARPSAESKNNAIIVLNALKNVKSENLGILFTFCDKNDMKVKNEEGVVKWKAWIKTVKKNCKNDILSSVPDKNVFFFSGRNGDMGPKTTQDDILDWFNEIVPDKASA